MGWIANRPLRGTTGEAVKFSVANSLRPGAVEADQGAPADRLRQGARRLPVPGGPPSDSPGWK